MIRKEKSSSPSPCVESQHEEGRDNPPPDANESHPVAASAEEGAVGGPPSSPPSNTGQLGSDSYPKIVSPQKEEKSSNPSPCAESQHEEVRDNPPMDANESHPVAASAEEGAVGGPPSSPPPNAGQLGSYSYPEIVWPQKEIRIYFTNFVWLPFASIDLLFDTQAVNQQEAFELCYQKDTNLLWTCYHYKGNVSEYGVVVRLGQRENHGSTQYKVNAKAVCRFHVMKWSTSEAQPPMNDFFKFAQVSMFKDLLPWPLHSDIHLREFHNAAEDFLKRTLTAKARTDLGKDDKFKRFTIGDTISEWAILPDGPEWTWAYSNIFFEIDENTKKKLLSTSKLWDRLKLIKKQLDRANKICKQLPDEVVRTMKEVNSCGILRHNPSHPNLAKILAFLHKINPEKESRTQEENLIWGESMYLLFRSSSCVFKRM